MGDMMSRLEARWQARGRTVIEIPELPDEHGQPTRWYAKPFTILDSKGLSPYLEASDDDGYVEVIIRKAEDADGEPLFDKGDKPKLKRILEAAIVKRVAIEIIASTDLEHAEKN